MSNTWGGGAGNGGAGNGGGGTYDEPTGSQFRTYDEPTSSQFIRLTFADNTLLAYVHGAIRCLDW